MRRRGLEYARLPFPAQMAGFALGKCRGSFRWEKYCEWLCGYNRRRTAALLLLIQSVTSHSVPVGDVATIFAQNPLRLLDPRRSRYPTIRGWRKCLLRTPGGSGPCRGHQYAATTDHQRLWLVPRSE